MNGGYRGSCRPSSQFPGGRRPGDIIVLVVWLVHGRVPMAGIIPTKLVKAALPSTSRRILGFPDGSYLNRYQ